MGYRSDVSLVLKRNLFNKIMEEVPEAGKRLLDYAKDLRVHGDDVLVVWNYVKWYYDDANTDVGKFCMALENNAESNNQYYLVTLGEDGESLIEGEYWDNPWETGVVRELAFNNNLGSKFDAFR